MGGLATLPDRHLTFDRQRHTHATANAQRSQAFLGIATLHFVQQGDQDAAARSTNRVTDGNGSPIDIDFAWINAQLLVHGTSLGGERFVQLEQINVSRTPTRTLQGLARSWHRTHAHRGGIPGQSGYRGDRWQL